MYCYFCQYILLWLSKRAGSYTSSLFFFFCVSVWIMHCIIYHCNCNRKFEFNGTTESFSNTLSFGRNDWKLKIFSSRKGSSSLSFTRLFQNRMRCSWDNQKKKRNFWTTFSLQDWRNHFDSWEGERGEGLSLFM